MFTRFNALLGGLLIVIVSVGQYRDALFGIVLVANTAIGIIQELRAKKTLNRLALLTAPRARVVRDSQLVESPVEAVVLDDILDLQPGDQLVVDAVMVDGELEVDESLVSGEADPVAKHTGDEVLSGSFVVAGSGRARAIRVGAGAYAQSLAAQAQRFTLVHSELREATDRILRLVTWVIGPTAVVLVISQLRSAGLRDAIGGSVAGIGAMVPEGLVLLTSVAFGAATLRLAKRRVLVQELAAVEGLARVDVVCIDKTGTLTEGSMRIRQVEPLTDGVDVDSVLGAIAAADSHPNASMRAIAGAYPPPEGWAVVSAVPFSSARKWSSVTFEGDRSWLIGAPEVLLDAAPAAAAVVERARALAATGQRVLLVARAPAPPENANVPAALEPVALVGLEEQIKPDAPDTLAYFGSQSVVVKVISGDNPVTVGAIAARLGVPGADQPVDARQLRDDAALGEVLEQHSVFGRVLPHQKRAMVTALRSRGHVVAMTGDGVNDALALKEADIGVAMASGSAATRAVAQLVLLDNRFAALPGVVAEGRRVIANVERVAKLFVTKTVYAQVLAVLVGVLTVPFPFLPRHLTIVSSLTIGIPGFFLALAPNEARFQPRFLRRVLSFAIPAGLVAATATFIAYAAARTEGVPLTEARTTATLVLVGVGLWVLTLLARPFTPPLIVLGASMGAAFAVVLAVPGLRGFFALEIPPPEVVATAAGVVASAVALLEAGRWVVAEWQDHRLARVGRTAERLLEFLAARLRPEGALGLTLTVLLALIASAGWVLGVIVQDVIAGDDAARLDRPVLDWLVANRQPWLTTVAQVTTALGSSAFLIPLVVIVGGLWWKRRHTPRALLLLGAAYLGADLLFRIIKAATGRARPPTDLAVGHFAGLAFPSGHATQAAAVWGMLAALVATLLPLWRYKAALWATAILIAAAVGVTRLYLGAHWLTDVLGGWALGALWLGAVLGATRSVDLIRERPARGGVP